jgi:predicted phosphate transport protein (TIGR00153 family)
VRLIPRDDEFFNMFAELANRLTASAKLLHQLFSDPARIDEFVAAIKKVEHEADNLTHEVIARINKTFVTPIDREDIHLLTSRLDDVIDLIDGIARRAAMFHIKETKPPAIRLAEVLLKAADAIEAAVGSMKKPAVVAELSAELKRLEEEGDAIYHQSVGELFLGTPDPIEVIKWKELYDTLEDAIDHSEDVANVLESISLKNA